MISENDIPYIDVKETLSVALGDPQCVFAILEAMAQEQKGAPVEKPPEDMWDLMIYSAEQDVLFFCVMPWDYPPQKATEFVKIPKPLQQKILFRSVFVYRKFFTFGNIRPDFPIRFMDSNEVTQ